LKIKGAALISGIVAFAGAFASQPKPKVQTRKAQTPPSLSPHAAKYKDGVWQLYKMYELGNWVHLLAKRAEHRKDPVKRIKDLTDAQNYLDMMQAKLDQLKQTRVM
jgi:hypothetical protein